MCAGRCISLENIIGGTMKLIQYNNLFVNCCYIDSEPTMISIAMKTFFVIVLIKVHS